MIKYKAIRVELVKHKITGRDQHLTQGQFCSITALSSVPDGFVLVAVDDAPPGVLAVGKNDGDLRVLGHGDGEVVWCCRRQFIIGSTYRDLFTDDLGAQDL
jgi:hypothetical protein